MRITYLVFTFLMIFFQCSSGETAVVKKKSRFFVEQPEMSALEEKGQCAMAATKMQKAVGVGQSDAWLFYNLGRCHLEMKKMGDAFSDFKTCTSIDPNYTGCYRGFGDYYRKNKNYSVAVEFYQKALKLSTDSKYNAQVYDSLAHVYYFSGNFDKALTFSNKSLEIDDTGDYYGINGLILYSKGSSEEALKTWRTALESKPFRFISSKAWVHYGLARYYFDKNIKQAAASNLHKSFELEPTEQEFLKLMAEIEKDEVSTSAK